ncbi:hypothetical protein BBJ28_00011655 [Nothophytophthora sp. Chile5]|nr:hypothetical protein BBJ28_00011655 [Nothophytophthora sp. Chile5]
MSAIGPERPDERDAVTTYRSLTPSSVPSSPADMPSSHRDARIQLGHQTESPRAGEATSVETADERDGYGDAARLNQWQRIVRDYRLLEFGCIVIMYLVALLFSLIEVNQRTSQLNRGDHECLKVPTWALTVFGIGLPVVANLGVNYVLPKLRPVRLIPHDTRDFLLSLLQSLAMAELLTQFTKNITGRFRPCFYDMCGWNYDVVWDGVTNLCTDAAGEKEGRKSFPSGHASFAWASMLVLTLFLLGRSRLNCANRAAWVAVTRCVDNWHHYADILAGSAIGAASAVLAYSYNYGSVFCWESAGLPCEEIHARRLHTKMSFERERQASGDYQTVATPPCARGAGIDGPTASAEIGRDGEARAFARPKKWQRLLREYRVVEFAGTGVMYLVGRALGKWMELNDRKYTGCSGSIMQGNGMNCLGIPIVVNLLLNYGLPKFREVRVIPHDVRDFLLSLGQAVTLSTILVNFTKNATGRFRPCFYELCGWNYDVIWDGVTNLCSDAAGERDGRKSFPSGHSSFAWSTMLVLSVSRLYSGTRAQLNKHPELIPRAQTDV